MPAAYSMTRLASTIATILDLPVPAQADPEPLEPIVADLRPAQKLAHLGPDALGHYPLSLWRSEMPFLSAALEARSVLLRAVMPSITPVNFATMISGADRPVHGVGAFSDDIQCETLFDVVRADGDVSAGIGQPGWTGSELLGRHADIWGKAADNDDALVEALVLQIARERAPRYLIAQIGNTDKIFHRHGPTSPEVIPGVREMDARLERMCAELLGLGYKIIINADHGQHDTPTGGSHGSDSDEDCLVECTWLG